MGVEERQVGGDHERRSGQKDGDGDCEGLPHGRHLVANVIDSGDIVSGVATPAR
jgi:hypothetical protein